MAGNLWQPLTPGTLEFPIKLLEMFEEKFCILEIDSKKPALFQSPK